MPNKGWNFAFFQVKGENKLNYLYKEKNRYFPMKKLWAYTLVLLIVCLASKLVAQENQTNQQPTMAMDETPETKTDWTKRLFTGGGIGLQVGGSYTYVGLSPILGYRITDKFSAGLGATYIYLQDKPNKFSTSVYGGKVFAEYDIYRGFSPHMEYEILNLEIYDRFVFNRKRINVDSFLIGASYVQPIGEHSGIYIMALFNLIEDIYTPYENPILRIGFNIGL